MATSAFATTRVVTAHGAASFSIAYAVRRSEWLILAFLIYAPALAFFLPASPDVRWNLIAWNLPLSLAYIFLITTDNAEPTLTGSITRDWLPLAAVLLAYREMGWFASPHTGALLESRWMVWDRLLLPYARGIIESLGPVIPSILEIAYSLVYALAPFAIAVLYLYGRRKQADRFLFLFGLSALLCYVQFPLRPSDPPRAVFPAQDLPAFDTVFRRFNLWMLGSYGIHTGVFPSAHVAGAFASAFGIRLTLPEVK